jgi:predicted RNase H-like nuclease (RuvC/YqgF family)
MGEVLLGGNVRWEARLKPDDERQVRQKIARRVFPVEERTTALEGRVEEQAQELQDLREQLEGQSVLIKDLRADLDILRAGEPENDS